MALPYDINTNATYQGILLACTCFIDLATGKRVMCLVCSDGGFGKTLLARRSFQRANVPFVQLGVTPNEHDFVHEVWRAEAGISTHKGRKAVVGISDDIDGMWTRVTVLNHVKSAYGADRRLIRFPTRDATRNQEYKDSEDERLKKRYRISIPPPQFDVTIRLCGLSNVDYTDASVITDPAARTHFAALVSKGLDPIWICNDPLQVFLYTHYIATEQNALGGAGFTFEVARLSVEFYVTNVHRLADIPPRRLTQIATVIRDNPPGDERDRRLNMMLRPVDQRPKLQLPASWVPVLLWPDEPPRRPTPTKPEPTEPPVAPPHAEQVVETTEPVAEQPVELPRAERVETLKPEPPVETPAETTPEPGTADAILDAALPDEFEARRGAFLVR